MEEVVPRPALDPHQPLCRGYRANQAFYAYGQMAHLLLRAVQYRLLPGPPGRMASARWCGM